MKKPIKIVLVGAQGTGKTSVMNQLPDEYKSIGIREVIRNMTKEDPTVHINTNGNEWSQNRFFFEYLYLFAKYPEYISDRGLLDVCAYTKWLAEMGNVPQVCYEKQMLILKDWLANHRDVIHVYFPICFPVVDDGYRDANEENRKNVDRCVREVIDELSQDGLLTIWEMDNAPVENRVKFLIGLAQIQSAGTAEEEVAPEELEGDGC